MESVIISLIPKSEQTEFLANYRPIALCQCTYKFFTRVLLGKMMEHATTHKIIDELQFGVRNNASVYQALLTYMAVIDRAIKEDKQLITLSIDLTKAFDSVTPAALLKTLQHYNFPENTIELVREIYSNNKSNLFTPIGKATEEIAMESGVKQGCALSPFLWVIYINPVLEHLRNQNSAFKTGNLEVSHITFMDDINIISESLPGLLKAVKAIEEAFAPINLKINGDKTILTARKPEAQNTVRIAGKDIPISEGTKSNRLLGLLINNNLNWDEQIATIRKSC